MHNPIWAFYLKKAYESNIPDLKKSNFNPIISSQNFTALLCGTAGSTTSKTFARYIFSRNPKTKLIILDKGDEQIEDSKKTLNSLFPSKNIIYLCEDALKTSLPRESIDYIETDGLFEFFSYKDLGKLLKEWDRILKDNGFITFRAYTNYSWFTLFFDKIKLFVGNKFLSVKVYAHSKKNLEKILNQSNFKWKVSGKTFLPGFLRFIMHK